MTDPVRWWMRPPTDTCSYRHARFLWFRKRGRLLVHGGLSFQRQIVFTILWDDRRVVGIRIGRNIENA